MILNFLANVVENRKRRALLCYFQYFVTYIKRNMDNQGRSQVVDSLLENISDQNFHPIEK